MGAPLAYPLLDSADTKLVTLPFEHLEKLPAMISRHGFAIVTNILSPTEIQRMESLLLRDLSALVDSASLARACSSVQHAWQLVQTEGVGAMPAATLADIGVKGRWQNRGLPHGEFAWAARTHERVRQVYAVLHGAADLVVSCDESFVAHSREVEAKTNPSWPHADQNDHASRVPCRQWELFQGLLYLWPSLAARSSSTVLWQGSRLRYAELLRDPNVAARMGLLGNKMHFTALTNMQPGAARAQLWEAWKTHASRAGVPAGDMPRCPCLRPTHSVPPAARVAAERVLVCVSGWMLPWSSRTLHQGWAGHAPALRAIRSRPDAAPEPTAPPVDILMPP